MTEIDFIKMHGCGNDFVIIDQRYFSFNLHQREIIRISDRNIGIGCDQLIVLEKSAKADCKMAIYNQDGSKALMCGNAARCVGEFLGLLHSVIEVNSNLLSITLKQEKVEVTIPINFSLIREYESLGTYVNVGNHHLVLFFDDVDNIDVDKIAASCRANTDLPTNLNVNFASILSNDRIKLRTIENGVGETLACGSGASATLIAANYMGLVGMSADIMMKGGQLHIKKSEDNVIMTGNATYVFKGTININE